MSTDERDTVRTSASRKRGEDIIKAAIYARMSTDRQSTDSPADQIARCQDFAQARGWQVAEELVVVEAGVSGASRHNRPGLLELVERMPEWDVLLCWDSSRLARDSEDLGWIRNRMRAHRRTGYEVSTGLDLFNVGAKVLGVMAEEYLVKLRADTQRGLRGRAERGLSTGGTPYGYRSQPVALDERGEPVEGAGRRIVVHEPEADVVRRIFARYLAGAGLRELAHRLNAEGVAPPRPRALSGRPASWAPTALREMLRNPIYAGERIFNRSEWVRDHEKGKRRRFERPPEEWIREQRPDLAIIRRDVFDATQAEATRRGAPYLRSAGGRLLGPPHGRGHRGPARHVLSGFLECGTCGGGFHAQNSAARYGCSWHRGRGPVACPSALTVPRVELEARVFGAIRERILTPDAIGYAVERALALVEAELKAGEQGPTDAERARLAEIDEDLASLRRMAARTGRSREVARLLAQLEAERAALAHRPAAAGAFDRGALRELVAQGVVEMRAAFEGGVDERRAAFRALLGDRRMRVLPDEARRFRVEGVFDLPVKAADARSHEDPGRLHLVVAGVGFEPTTSGL